MARGHPTDRYGRVLPHCSWPLDRCAPGVLETVRRFCNTTNLESGADRLADSTDFAEWLAEEGHGRFVATESERGMFVQVREIIRDAATAHRDGDGDAEALARLQQFVAPINFRLDVSSTTGAIAVDPEHGHAGRLIGSLALAVIEARANGTWDRLKSCRRCRWVVYDHSKNRSGQWCSMSACGGRAKVRNHRARRRDASSDERRA